MTQRITTAFGLGPEFVELHELSKHDTGGSSQIAGTICCRLVVEDYDRLIGYYNE
jgi:hypothetical protein